MRGLAAVLILMGSVAQAGQPVCYVQKQQFAVVQQFAAPYYYTAQLQPAQQQRISNDYAADVKQRQLQADYDVSIATIEAEKRLKLAQVEVNSAQQELRLKQQLQQIRVDCVPVNGSHSTPPTPIEPEIPAQGGTELDQKVKALLTKGKCASCHGPDSGRQWVYSDAVDISKMSKGEKVMIFGAVSTGYMPKGSAPYSQSELDEAFQPWTFGTK